jgi:hypothetical protein
MPRLEHQHSTAIQGVPVSAATAEEIEEVLEMLRRVKRVHLARRDYEQPKKHGNCYALPKRLVYKVTRSY